MLLHWVCCDHLFRQTLEGNPLVKSLGKENAEGKHRLWSRQSKAVSDCWGLLFPAIPARNSLSTLSFPGAIILSPFLQYPLQIQWFLPDQMCSVIKKRAKPQPLENRIVVPTKERISFRAPPKKDRKCYPPGFVCLIAILKITSGLCLPVLSQTNFPGSQI